MVTTEEFISNFHSLHGVTIGEKRKNLFLLLNQIQEAGFTDIDFSSLHPKTFLEEKFKVETLIYFKKIPELVEVLKSENPILIERVLKTGPWFWEQVFQDITGEQLATTILPSISFNVKVKVLNKLSFCLDDSQKADEYFHAINQKYGLHLASKLLICCSSDVIMNYVKLKHIKPTPKQLLIIIKKHPQLTESILKMLQSNGVNVKIFYKNVFIYIARHDYVQFFKFSKEYNLSMCLGWRTTDKFVQAAKSNVVKNPREYYELLHKKQMIKSLKVDFSIFFYNLFPTSLSKLEIWYERIFDLIELFPVDKRNLDLLLATFKKVYGTELWEHPKYVSTKFLKMLSPDERQNRLKLEYKPPHFTEDDWNCYWKVDNSIPYLKKRISLTSDVKARVKLIRCLVTTCKINEDKVALLYICRYMLIRHRNDHITVRLVFLTALFDNFELETLSEEHWVCINELIQIFSLNKEYFYDTEFLESYIHFRLLNNMPVREELIKWLNNHTTHLNIIDKAPQYQKRCLMEFGEIIPQIYKNDDLKNYNLSFLASLIKWNNKYPKDKISLYAFKSAMTTLKELLTKQEYIYQADFILVYCLQENVEDMEQRELLNLYLKITNKYVDIDVIDKLMLREPSIVKENFSRIINFVLQTDEDRRTNMFFWKHCRYYSHLEIPQQVKNICLTKFQEPKGEDISRGQHETIMINVIIALSYIMTANEFSKFVVPYYPSQLKVDINNKEAQEIYGLQKAIGNSFKNVIPASKMLEGILNFCKGDFLKLVRRSLFSVSDNANENKLLSSFNELSKRAVSVRKHAMHLTFRLMDKTQVYNMVKLFMEGEKNPSIRKFILKGVFNFFVKNFDDYSWELVKANVNALDVTDKEGFGLIMQTTKIPSQYMGQYITFTWDIVGKLPDRDDEIKSKRATLLDSITPDIIQVLSPEFCDSVIQEYIFKEDHLSIFQEAIHRFTCKYIIYSMKKQEEHLMCVFSILKNYVAATWDEPETRSEGRECVQNFAKEFCGEFLTPGCQEKEVLIKFINLWNDFLKPHESFDVYLHLEFTLIKASLIHAEELSVPEIAQKLVLLCNQLTNVYGSIIINMFYEKVKFFLPYFCNEDCAESTCRFIENVLHSSSSTASALLVILLLNDIRPIIAETEVKYEKIIEILLKKSEPVIQLYLGNHFQGL